MTHDLITKMNAQWNALKAIAEQNAAIANQALDQRNAAHVALLECQQALEVIRTIARPHYSEQNALEMVRTATDIAIARCKAILEPEPQKFWETP